jgi:hypothetical protein
MNTFNLSLDYGKLCYVMEIVSERPVIKVMLKGEIVIHDGSVGVQFKGN